MTTTISQTIWRTSTYISSVTSPVTNTETITSYSTITETLDLRSTITVIIPTTKWITQKAEAGKLEIVEVIVEPQVAVMKKGWAEYLIKITVKNRGSHDETVYLGINIDGYDPSTAPWNLDAKSDIPQDIKKVVKAGQKETFEFPMRTTWRWLGNDKTVVTGALGKVFAEWAKAYGGVGKGVGPFISAIFGGPSILSDLQLMNAAIWKLNVLISESSDSTLTFQTRATLEADVGKRTSLCITLACDLISTGIATVQLVASLAPQAIAALLLTSFFLWAVGLVAYKAAVDPEPEYTKVQQVRSYIIEEVENLPEGYWKDIAKTSLNLFSRYEALSTAMARYYAAAEDGNIEYMVKQLSAAVEFSEKVKENCQELSNLFEELPKDSTRPNASKIREFKETLLREGPPNGFVKLMKKAGLEGYIDQAISDFEAASEDFFEVPSADNVRTILKGLDDLSESIKQEKRELEHASTPWRYFLEDLNRKVQLLLQEIVGWIKKIQELIEEFLKRLIPRW
jgi:hypothetical protein